MLLTDRQTAFFSHDFSRTFFFSMEKEKILKVWISLFSEKVSISFAKVALILFSMLFFVLFCFFFLFFHVLRLFCSFLFFIKNTRDKRDNVNFLLLVTQIYELSQKYDYPLLIVPDLICFSKYEISIHRCIIISKILFETKRTNTASIFAWLFQTDQIVTF